jgi:hypothetical protein
MMVEQEAQRMKEIGGIGDMEMLIRLKERKGKELSLGKRTCFYLYLLLDLELVLPICRPTQEKMD